jgi:hypothetical protein
MTARNFEFSLILITPWMQSWLVKVPTKYLKYFIFRNDLLYGTTNKGKITFRVTFEVLTAILMKIPVARNVRLYGKVNIYRCFEGLYYLEFHSFSETSVTTIRQGLTTKKSLFFNYLYISLCHSVGTLACCLSLSVFLVQLNHLTVIASSSENFQEMFICIVVSFS